MQHNIIRKFFVIGSVLLATLTSCHHDTLEDRAAKETKEYTTHYCPTPYENNTRTDSIVFEKGTRTFHYYYKVNGKLDNQRIFTEKRDTLRAILLNDLKENTQNKTFKEHGFSFRYTFSSASNGNVLLDVTFSRSDYNRGNIK